MNDKPIGFDLPHLLPRESHPGIASPALETVVTPQPPSCARPPTPGWTSDWNAIADHPLVRENGIAQTADDDENTALAPLSFSSFLWAARYTPHVHCCVPAYPGMAAGDRITVRWGDEKFDLPPLQPGDVGRPVLAAVPVQALEPIRAGDRLELSYCSISAQGQRTGWARPCLLQAREAGLGALYVHAAG
jgi:hypothetical protein